MTGFISADELRHNPTRVLREVEAGASYMITEHGDPVAEVVPLHRHRWVPSAEVDALLQQLGGDVAWGRDVAADRPDEGLTDPWGPAE